MPKEEALIEIKNCAGTQFDPKLVKVFIEMLKKGKNKIQKQETR